jgi:hypothetical protein
MANDELPRLTELLGDLKPPKRAELHCHRRVVNWLRLTSREAELPDGAIGGLTGVLVVEDADMEPGAWERRQDGEVTASGNIGMPWLDVLAEPLKIEFRPYDLGALRRSYAGHWPISPQGAVVMPGIGAL